MSNTTLETETDPTLRSEARIDGTELGDGAVDVEAVRRARDPNLESPTGPVEEVSPVSVPEPENLASGGFDRDSLLREVRSGAPSRATVADSDPLVMSAPEPDPVPVSVTRAPVSADLDEARRRLTEVLEEQAAEDRRAGRRAEDVAERVLRRLESEGMDPALVAALREDGPEKIQRAYDARQTELGNQQRAAETAITAQARRQAQSDFSAGTAPDPATVQRRFQEQLEVLERSGQYDASVIAALREAGPAAYERTARTEQSRLQTQLDAAERSIRTNASNQASADFASNTQPSEDALRQRHTAGLAALRSSNSYDPAVLAALERTMAATYQASYSERRTALGTQRTDFENKMAELARSHAAQDAQLTAPRSADDQRRVNEQRERERAALREGVDPAVLQASQGGTARYQAAFTQHFDAEFNRHQSGRETARQHQVNAIEQDLLRHLDRNTSPDEIARRISDYARNHPGVLTDQDVERLARNSMNTVQARYDHWYDHESTWLERRREDIRNFVNDVGQFLGDCLRTVRDGLAAIGRSLRTAGELLAAAGRGIRDASVAAVNWAGEKLEQATDWVVEQGAKAVKAVVEFAKDPIGHLEKAAEAVGAFLQDRWDQVCKGFNSCVAAIGGAIEWVRNLDWKEIGNSIANAARSAFNYLTDPETWKSIGSAISDGFSWCVDKLDEARKFLSDPKRMWEAAVSLYNGAKDIFTSAWNAVTNLDNWKAAANWIGKTALSIAESTGIADIARGACNVVVGIATGNSELMWQGVSQLGQGIQRYGECLLTGATAAWGFICDVSEALGVTDMLVGIKDIAIGIATLDPSKIASGFGSLAKGTVRLVWECTGLADAWRAVSCLGTYLYKGLTGQGWDTGLLVEGLVSLGAAALSIGSIVATGGAAVALVGGIKAVGTQVVKKLATQGFKALGKELGEQIVQKCSKVLAKEVVEKASKEMGLKAGKECAEKFGKEAAEYCAKHGLTELPQSVAKEMAERIAREQAQIAAREGTERMLKEAGVEKIVKDQVLEALEKVSKGNLDDLVKKGVIDARTAKAMQKALNKGLCDDLLKEALTKEITDALTKDIVQKGEKAFMEGFMESMEKSGNKYVQEALKDKVVREAFEKGAREGYEKGVREAVEKVVRKAVDDAFDEHRKRRRRHDMGDGVAEDMKMIFFSAGAVGSTQVNTDLVARNLMNGNEVEERKLRKTEDDSNEDTGPQAVSIEEADKRKDGDVDERDRPNRVI